MLGIWWTRSRNNEKFKSLNKLLMVFKILKMRINTALILCAGFGKRLNPITLKTPNL